jgi:hypothetical protein
MSYLGRIFAVVILCLSGLSATDIAAQQVQVSTPLNNVNDSFYERFGIDWGFQGRNWFFNTGAGNSGIPAFGGYDANADARFGFGFRGSGGSGFFQLAAGQGSSRSIVSSTPSVVMQNGSIGSVRDISVRPFVTGFIPVVGDSPVVERLERLRREASTKSSGGVLSDQELLLGVGNSKQARDEKTAQTVARSSGSTAERGDISLAEIRRSQATTPSKPEGELKQLIEQARLAEASGRAGAARIRYQRAAAKATGELKQELLAKAKSLNSK